MHDSDLIIALKEEIGNPQLFTGRQKEMIFLMDWVERVKKELADSQVLLARKRRGKTALVQRFYNILYTRNDPKLIPIYFRVPDAPIDYESFTLIFFLTQVKQYLAHKLRRPELIKARLTPDDLIQLAGEDRILVEGIEGVVKMIRLGRDLAWHHVREFCHDLAERKDERIIQIIDEFQFLNEMVLRDGEPIKLCSGYQMTGSSKVSPQIITGSYIGWLDTIVRRMVGRYSEFRLDPLPVDEALATIYTYARLFEREITPVQAAYLAELCHYDPFYIACIFKSSYPTKGPITEQLARDILAHETRIDGGNITKMWGDYIHSAIERVNSRYAKKIILYLAKHVGKEFTRDEIREDLKLELSDDELEQRMEKLVKSDILAQGSTMFHYKGLGDPIFEVVFRRLYEAEIEGVDIASLEAEVEQRFAGLKGQLANAKGLAAEEKIRYYLSQAGRKGVTLSALSGANVSKDRRLGPFVTINKRSLHLAMNRRLEIDMFAQAESADDPDMVVEVKDWARPVGVAVVDEAIARKKIIEPLLEREAIFLIYSESGFSKHQAGRLAKHQILACDATLLPPG